MNGWGPSTLANRAGEGLWRRGHDDGAHGGTPASLHALRRLTKCCQRARGEAMGCWGDGGAMAVVLEWLGASCARLWRRRSCESSAAAAARKKGRGEAKMERGWVRAGAGVMKARPGALWPARIDRRRRAADSHATRRQCSAPVDHRNGDSVRQTSNRSCLTARFADVRSLKPCSKIEIRQQQTCRSKYHLQLLLRQHTLIRNINRVKSSPK